MRIMRLAAACWLVAIAAPALAGGKVALVVGNAGYAPAVGPLRNPTRDAAAIAAALRARGFAVTVITNASRVALLAAVDDYAHKLAAAGPDSIGFFYYSGHGVANPADGRNYLVPVDASTAADNRLWYESVPLQDLVRTVTTTAGAATNIVVFDACREALALPQGKGLGNGGKGLQPISEVPSTLIAFSTSPNAIAADADDSAATGPYATELAAHLASDSDVKTMFDEVKYAVYRRTGNKQLPWVEDGLTARVLLGGEAATAPAAAALVRTAPLPAAATAPGPTQGPFVLAKPPVVPGADFARWGLAPTDLNWMSVNQLDEKVRFKQRAGELATASAAGDPVAALLLGYASGSGLGMKTDPQLAFANFQKAAAAGLPRGMSSLAAAYQGGLGTPQDRDRALQLYKAGAEGGDGAAMVAMYNLLNSGVGTPRDPETALRWLLTAVGTGYARAKATLAYKYSVGQDVAHDDAEAFRLYLGAAQGGDLRAYVPLARLYENGQGTARDLSQALVWYSRAAEYDESAYPQRERIRRLMKAGGR